MKRNPAPSRDPLDDLLASHPVVPSADFTDKIFARLAAERDAASPGIDAMLAARTVSAPAGFVDRVMVAVAAERRKKFVLFRIVAPAALAACFALAAIPAFNNAGNRNDSTDSRLAAVVSADAELRSLAALPDSPGNHLADIAVFADIDAALSATNTEYAYGI